MTGSIFAGAPDYQAVFLWEFVRFLEELHGYTLSHAGNMDNGTLHGFTSRIGAMRDDLIDELPTDPRVIPFRVKPQGGTTT
ncbi:MAG: hypothetical protein LBK08_05850 [Treponema sp.]|jgi:hypothetical protein|nr:hypothetical protein [Treponema sp.]